MGVVELTEENIEQFADYLTEDIAENIGRTFYSGLIISDDQNVSKAGIVWEYKNMLNDSDKESKIVWLKADDEQSFMDLFEAYGKAIKLEGIVKSSFVLPAKTSKDLKMMLKDKGFTVELMEGDKITARLSEMAKISAFNRITISEAIMPLRSATQRAFSTAISKTLVQGHYGTCEDLAYLPRLYFENDVSCYAEIDGQITGLLLLHKTPSEKLELVLMFASGKESVRLLPQMIKQSLESAYECYEPETEIIIDRHDYASLALGEKLLPSSFGIPVYTGSREET